MVQVDSVVLFSFLFTLCFTLLETEIFYLGIKSVSVVMYIPADWTPHEHSSHASNYGANAPWQPHFFLMVPLPFIPEAV